MEWIYIGIVFFAIFGNISAQQGYNYPAPETPFPGRPAPGNKPNDTQKPFGAPSLGSYSQQGPSRPPVVYPGPSTRTDVQEPSEAQEPTSVFSGSDSPQKPFGVQRPSVNFPSQQSSSGSPVDYPQSNKPQQPFGSQKPSDGFPTTSPSASGQQGYNYPTPGKSFPGDLSTDKTGPHSSFPSLTVPSGLEKPSSVYSGQQESNKLLPGQLGKPGLELPSGRVQIPFRPLEGQSPSGYTEPKKTSRPQFPSDGTQTPSFSSGQSLGQYPTPDKPLAQIGVQYPPHPAQQQTANGYSETGSQFPSDRQPIPSKPISGYPSASTPFGEQEAPQQQGSGRYPDTEKPTGSFPTGVSQETFRPNGGYPSSGAPSREQGVPEQQGPILGKPISSQLPTSGLQRSFSSINTYPSPSVSLENQQIFKPQGSSEHPSSGGSTTPQLSTNGFQKPSGLLDKYPSSQFVAGGKQIPGQQSSTGYSSPVRPIGAQFPTGGLQGPFAQRPFTTYLLPDQSTGKVPTSPQISLPGQPGTVGITSAPSLPAVSSGRPQSGYTPPGTPTKGGERQTGLQIPSGQPQRPNEYPRSEGPGRPQTGYEIPQTVHGRPIEKPSGLQGVSSSQGIGSTSGPQGDFTSQPGVSQVKHSDEGIDEEQSEGDFSAIPGEPEIDYPIFSFVPKTLFSCDEQTFPGYYADVAARCQAFHICANNKTYDFLCPNGTVFHQENLVCVWWNKFDCNSAPSFYDVNEHIYDFSITGIQQTGGIPVAGQDFPVSSERPEEYPSERGSTFSFSGRHPTARPQIHGNASQKPTGYSEGQLQTLGIGSPTGGYPSGQPQGVSFPSSPSKPLITAKGPFRAEPVKPSGIPSSPQGANGYPTPTPIGPQTSGIAFKEPGGRPTDAVQGFGAGYPSIKPHGPESIFPLGPQQPSISFPLIPGVQTPGSIPHIPGGYSSGTPQGQNFPTASQILSGSPQIPTGLQRPEVGTAVPGGFSLGVPQGPRRGPQRPEGFSSGKPQGPNFPSAPVTGSQRTNVYSPVGGSQTSEIGAPIAGGYSSGANQGLDRGSEKPEGYPSGRPQGPSFLSGPVTGSQTNRYSPAAGSQKSEFGIPTPGKYPSSAVQRPENESEKSEGYASGRPQETSFPLRPATGSSVTSGYSPIVGPQKPKIGTPIASGYSSGAPQGPGREPEGPQGYPNEKPQGSITGPQTANGFLSGLTRTSVAGIPATGRYPFEVTREFERGLQRPQEYPRGRTQKPSFPLDSAVESQRPEGYPSGNRFQGKTQGISISPSRAETLFPGSPQPHEPTREYLPTANRK